MFVASVTVTFSNSTALGFAPAGDPPDGAGLSAKPCKDNVNIPPIVNKKKIFFMVREHKLTNNSRIHILNPILVQSGEPVRVRDQWRRARYRSSSRSCKPTSSQSAAASLSKNTITISGES